METMMHRLSREADVIEERRERRDAHRAMAAAVSKPKAPLQTLLVWRMCSDPWPGGDMAAIDEWLNDESRAAGFKDWIDAYHRL